MEAQQIAPGSEILNTEWFRTYGLLVQETGSEVKVFVSHNYWQSTQQCWVERVSMLKSDRAAFLRGEVGAEWKTLYETTPCLPVHGENRRHGTPFVGYFGGGRMAMLDAQTLLLTVGDFGFDGLASLEAVSQNPAVSYGKTIANNIADGRAALFTLGNRNPQGLFVDRSGTIWSTEHGPQGGDELNRLERGKNYGWPYATYGTQYGSFSWPLNKPEARDLIEGHDGRIILWTDDDTLVSLRPNEGTSGEALFAEKCGGCHTTEPTGGNTIGPNLRGVVGRRVASLSDYPNYSPALSKLGGAWTKERLDVFVAAPGTACPGTAMDYAGDANAEERAAIISYLGTLR